MQVGAPHHSGANNGSLLQSPFTEFELELKLCSQWLLAMPKLSKV